MPAWTKVALATALAFPLLGGATALAQSTASPQGHTTYVTIRVTEDDGGGSAPILSGAVPCEAAWTQRLARAFAGQPACEHDGYAYAFPRDQPAPWHGQVRWVNDTQHVADDGELYHVTEIAYRVFEEGPDGGPRTVHAIAGELLPIDRSDRDSGARYELPLREDVLGEVDGQVEIQTGPAPDPTL